MSLGPMTAVFAHRGCTEGFTENTLDAFAEAGAPGRRRRRARCAADRPTGPWPSTTTPRSPGVGPVAELEVADLPAHVPLLADVLAVCEGMVVNVEIKNAPGDPGWDPDETVAAVTAAAIAEAGWTERVIVSSFQPATLRAVQAADGRLALGALWGFADRRRGRPWPWRWRRAAPPSTRSWLIGVPRAGRPGPWPGLAVNVWTVNAARRPGAMVELGSTPSSRDRLTRALAVATRGRAGP